MLRALSNTADQVNRAEPISVRPPKIREQIKDNKAIIDDLDNRGPAFAMVQRDANDIIARGNKSDPAIKDLKNKLDKLNKLWDDLHNATSKRGAALDDAHAVAVEFWRQLQEVMEALRDLKESLISQEPPAAQTDEIKKQQVALEEIRKEKNRIKQLKIDVADLGRQLMKLCGEPEEPERPEIVEMKNAWKNITDLFARRELDLINALGKAMEFQETLKKLLDFLAKAEDRFVNLGPIGADIDAVKKQIEQLRRFKDDVDPFMVEVEALNR